MYEYLDTLSGALNHAWYPFVPQIWPILSNLTRAISPRVYTLAVGQTTPIGLPTIVSSTFPETHSLHIRSAVRPVPIINIVGISKLYQVLTEYLEDK